jgi:hypothetical protein
MTTAKKGTKASKISTKKSAAKARAKRSGARADRGIRIQTDPIQIRTEIKFTAPAAPQCTTIDVSGTQKKLYKVLSKDGASQNGGSLTWSLPEGDSPGAWHEVPNVLICNYGLHLTTEPTMWFTSEGSRVFEVEAEDISPDRRVDKCVARKVRLLRELKSEAELAEVGIFISGDHEAKGDRQYRASGSANVTACDSANVTARDSAKVTACDSANVTAYGSANVTAYGSAKVTAYDSANVTAYGSAKVTAYGSANVTACDSANVTAYGSAKVTAYDSANVTAYGSAKVTAYGSANVTARDSANVTACDSANVTAYGSAKVTARDSANVNASGAALVDTRKGYWGNKAVVTLTEKAIHVDYRTDDAGEIKRAA